MKNLLKLLSPFAPDQSGAAAVLYELGGLMVICDAGGCAGNVCGFDEPRWFTKKSAVFSAGLRDMDAILGRDDRLIEKLSKACEQIRPAFTAIIGTPVPAVIATDMRALKRMAEKKTGLPCITAECTGTNYYDSGSESVWLDLFKTFSAENQPIEKGRLGIIGATPLELGIISSERIAAEYKAKGWENVICYGMASTLEDVKNAAAAEKNIVCSSAAIKAAEYLKEKFGTPYEIEYPKSCLPDEVIEKAGSFADKKVLVIHTQTAADTVRKLIKEKSGAAKCTAATFFMQKKELLQQGDIFFADESDLCDVVGDNYDIVIADRTLRRVMKNFKGEFIDFPHFGLSGRLMQGESEKI